MAKDSYMRALTEVGGLIDKRNEILKNIANKIALLAEEKMKDGGNLASQDIAQMVKDLSYEEQCIVYPMVIQLIVRSNKSETKKNNNYNSNDIFKGRGF